MTNLMIGEISFVLSRLSIEILDKFDKLVNFRLFTELRLLNFRSEKSLRNHIRAILYFYYLPYYGRADHWSDLSAKIQNAKIKF